jgi:hypothetical protein
MASGTWKAVTNRLAYPVNTVSICRFMGWSPWPDWASGDHSARKSPTSLTGRRALRPASRRVPAPRSPRNRPS